MTIRRRIGRHNSAWFLTLVLVLGMASALRADDPTSRFLPLSPLLTSLPAGSSGLTVQFEVWDQATGGTMVFSETHTVDIDAGANITNDTGRTDLLLGRGIAGGLVPANFPSGSTRYLDVTQGGVTVLAARLPLYASVFSIAAPNDVPGNLTLVNSSATAGNIFKGGTLFLSNFGVSNTFLGENAGNLSMSGSGNTAVGRHALNANTNGVDNNAFGANALTSNTMGNFNAAFGINALFANTTGSSNSAFGDFALNANTADNNSAFGFEALFQNTTGSDNSAFGYGALNANQTGNYNAAFGQAALGSNGSSNNSAFGFAALQANTDGNDNSAFGYKALNQTVESTANFNSAFGSSAMAGNIVGHTDTAMGAGALQNNTSGSENAAIGFDALLSNTAGGGNAALGFRALESNTTGDENTAIGSNADVSAGSLFNATAIGFNAVVNASNKIRLGNNRVTVIEGQVAYTFTSDRNQKENFRPVDSDEVLSKISGLNLTSWNYIGNDPKQFRHYGPVAQEFFAAFGHDDVGTIGTPTTINSGDMEGILMIAVQALEKRTAALGELEAQNADLKARLEKYADETDAQKRANEAQQTQLAAQQQEINRLNTALQSQQAARQAEMLSLREEVKALRDLLQKSGADNFVAVKASKSYKAQ